jgi:uroporphyrinogen decarboxylase
MNSRERVIAAIEHRTPDRVPIDFGATRQTGIMAGAYYQLKKHLGIGSGETFVFDIYQMMAEIEAPVRERMGSDVVALRSRKVAFGVPNVGSRPWSLADGTPVTVSEAFEPVVDEKGDLFVTDASGEKIAQMPAGGLYFDKLGKSPGAAHVDPDKWGIALIEQEELSHLETQADFWRENSEYAVIGELPAVELFYGFGDGGFDDWMVTLMSEQGYVRELYEKALEGMCANFDLFNQAVGGKIDIAKFNDDFGMQNSEFAPPELMRELVIPYYKRYIQHIKSRNPKVKIMQHSCGSIFQILGDMIDAGVEAINPVQTSAANMEPERLKETYGKKVCFWGGGVENQRILQFGTAEDVARQARERLDIFSPGGGFVFTAIHNIQHGTPPENVVAAFDTAREYRY